MLCTVAISWPNTHD